MLDTEAQKKYINQKTAIKLELKGKGLVDGINVQFANGDTCVVKTSYEFNITFEQIPLVEFPIVCYGIEDFPVDCNIGLGWLAEKR